jgi:hypothetical protein
MKRMKRMNTEAGNFVPNARFASNETDHGSLQLRAPRSSRLKMKQNCPCSSVSSDSSVFQGFSEVARVALTSLQPSALAGGLNLGNTDETDEADEHGSSQFRAKRSFRLE